MFLNSEKIRFEDLASPGDKFQLLDIIGEGTYGEVYAATDLELESSEGRLQTVTLTVLLKTF